jgi:nicotinate-nucleotide pyrophosphorylase (carboxylating)
MAKVHGSIINLVRLALSEDVGRGDVTSLGCLDPDLVKAAISAKSDGIMSGLTPLSITFGLVDSANKVKPIVQDGQEFHRGDTVVEIEGLNQTILTAERTALNFLAHLSGVATLTRLFADAVKDTDTTILDTRKTLPGWRMLEKQAVVHGGGANHRMGLFDMILIKDNHIAAAGSISGAVRRARDYLASSEYRLQFDAPAGEIDIEVEVTNESQVTEAIECGVRRLLLDNQSPESLRALVDKARQLSDEVMLEASGGANLDNVAKLAATGVDFISVGALTHSATAADFSLNIVD